MLKRLTLPVALLALGVLLAACSAPATNTNSTTSANSTTNSTAANTSANAAANANAATAPANRGAGTTTGAGSLSDPKGSIAYQFDLVKAGDLEKLKACLTPRARAGLTKEMLDKAKVDAAKYTIDDLYASAEMGEADGKKTAKVKMKNGRTLTTLIETNGQWLADTIWFN